MELTKRDVETLHSVHLLRVATREQLERLHFGQTSMARHRLKLLYHNSYLDRLPMLTDQGVWAWRPVYRLAKKGAELVAKEQGVEASKLAWWRKGFDAEKRRGVASALFVEHWLKINDVRIAVTLAAKHWGFQVEQWLDEAQLKSRQQKGYVTVHRQGGQGIKVAVVPDGYFVLNLGKRRAHFFLELDLATMSNPRWRGKVLAYLRYLELGKYQTKYQTSSLRILTVTTTENRLLNLERTTEKASGSRLFWFTTLDQAMANDILLDQIWSVVGETSPKPLISLAG
jgi:Replication-relaxation